jgi:hypothetical protein
VLELVSGPPSIDILIWLWYFDHVSVISFQWKIEQIAFLECVIYITFVADCSHIRWENITSG